MKARFPENLKVSRVFGYLGAVQAFGAWASVEYYFPREVAMEKVRTSLKVNLLGWLPVRLRVLNKCIAVDLMKDEKKVLRRLFHYSPTRNRKSIFLKGLEVRAPEVSDPRNFSYLGVYLVSRYFEELGSDLENQHEGQKEWDKWMVVGATEVYRDHEWNWGKVEGDSFTYPAYRSPASIPPERLRLVKRGCAL